MTQHIILAYGRETEHRRAIFAILSFWAWYAGDKANVQTLVFTDQPEFFKSYLAGLPVSYVLLTAERLEEMYGPQRYIHRAKVTIIDQVFRDHPNDSVLFCDSDTFFVAESAQLLSRFQPSVSFMHLREYRLADAVGIYDKLGISVFPRKLINLIETRTFRVGLAEQRFRTNQYLWNSGVLGLTKEVADLLPDIRALNDAFYAGSEWVQSEQIAFSLALQTKTRLLPSDQYVFHYWNTPLKALMDKNLIVLLSNHFSQLELTERLAQVRQLTTKWPRAIKFDYAREGALEAFAASRLLAGAKFIVKATLASPFNMALAKDLYVALREKSKK